MEEGIVNDNYGAVCDGQFDKIANAPWCWLHSGHGYMNAVSGITNSCNVFMNQVAYDLGMDANGKYSDSLGVEKLMKYANLFRLNEKSGLEITEVSPTMSTSDALRTSIGQSDLSVTTSQLARYVTTIASRGTSYELSLLDKVTDSKGEVIEDYTPEVKGDMDVADYTWTTVQAGMRGVAQNNASLSSLGISVAGKTGTAQEDLTLASHMLCLWASHLTKTRKWVLLSALETATLPAMQLMWQKISSAISTSLQMNLILSQEQHLLLTQLQYETINHRFAKYTGSTKKIRRVWYE